MEEENRSFSWSGLFIKIILVVVFILFTIWLLSLSNKDISGPLDVLTDEIFSENLEKMKKVGKEYFTKEKLPSKKGGIEKLTLKEMYEKKLLVEIKDKNGDACSEKNSYVSVEKLDDEYQMKVYLECGDEKDHVILNISCTEFGTCATDDNEEDKPTTKPTTNKPTTNKPTVKPTTKVTEYEYKKINEGTWSSWSDWSEWSKVAISKSDDRDVETKIEKEINYNTTTETTIEYKDFDKNCPNGYTLTADKTKCYKIVMDTTNPICNKTTGFVSQSGLNCKYIEEEKVTLTCPAGYVQSGDVCKKTTTTLKLVDTTKPVCPQLEGYNTTNRNGFTCTYTKHTRGNYVETLTGETIPKDDENYMYIEVGKPEYKLVCNGNDCNMQWVHIYAKYESITETKQGKATCNKDEYVEEGDVCNKYEVHTDTTEEKLTCPTKSGYALTQNGTTCTYKKEVTKEATCPSGYNQNINLNTCVKTTTKTQDFNKTCSSGYTLSKDGSKCEKEVTKTVNKAYLVDVTYYRYRTREYINGTTIYKWSSSKNDTNLLNDGYKLTGNTR